MQYQYGRNVAPQANSFRPWPSRQQNVAPLGYSFRAPQASNHSSPTYPRNTVPLTPNYSFRAQKASNHSSPSYPRNTVPLLPNDSFTSSPAQSFPRSPSLTHPLLNLSSESQTLQSSQMEFNKADLRETNYSTNGNYPSFGDQMFFISEQYYKVFCFVIFA